MLITLYENGKLFDVFQFVAASLCIVEFAADVGVAITEEEVAVVGLFLAEHFHIDIWQCPSCVQMHYFEFAEYLEDLHFDLVAVVCPEFLLTSPNHFNHHVLILEVFMDGHNHTGYAFHGLLSRAHLLRDGVEGLHVAEVFRVFFEEGLPGEEDFSVDDVVLYLQAFYVHGFEGQVAS